MKINQKESFSFWFVLLITISILFIIQTSFWPDILSKYKLVPQLTLPLIIYFFSQKNLFSSLLFTLFISLISSSFSVTPLPHLLMGYLILCILTQLGHSLFSGKKKNSFLVLLFIGSFLFPILIQNLLKISETKLYFSINLTSIFFNSLTTSLCGLLLYPFLQKIIKEKAWFS